jgi:hypothetical protein
MSVREKLVEFACLRWQMQEERLMSQRGPRRNADGAIEHDRRSPQGAGAASGKPADRREDLLR